MKLREILEIVEGTPLYAANLDVEIVTACASDLMSDVLAFGGAGSVLLTGLCNLQVVRTAEIADIAAIIFVRGKLPPPETIELAQRKGIPLAATPYTMFEMCGRLYQAGVRGCPIPKR